MAKKSKFIPGIYNYCDRWCERCTFTSRCMNYENTSDIPPEELEISNKAFWDRIGKNFENAIKMMRKAAKEHGIDIDSISAEESEAYEKNKKKKNEDARKHSLSVMTMDYIKKGRQLLEHTMAMEEKANAMIRNAEMGIQSEDELKKEAADIRNCQEIIHWYLHFIHVKFMRAIMGNIENDGWEEENGYPKDSDGSAKIALIAIDRSIEAWTTLIGFIPELEDEAIELLALLQKSRRMAETEFPKARDFIRPGFDTGKIDN